jgi:pimeloyl-ACP methyl ester carboxylesterase
VDRERIALWGTSFGGANAVVAAAAEPSVRALVVQLTFASGRRVILGNSTPEQADKLTSTLARVLERAVTRNQVLCMDPDQILSDPESKAFFSRYAPEHPALKTKIPLAAVAHVLEHEPELVASRLSCPLLVIGATQDQVCPPEESQRLFELGPEPKRLVMLSCGHFEAYQGEAFESRGAAVNPGSA